MTLLLLRRLSFWLSLAGLFSAYLLIQQLRAEKPIPPPPIAPPAKPATHGLAASGLVEALHENTHVGSPIPGLATAVHINVGDRVEAGAPLFTLDDRDLRATLISQRAQIDVATATLARASDQLKRTETLHASGTSTDNDLELRRHDVAIATAQLAATRAAIAQTETLLLRYVVRAPITGTVLQLNLRVGEYISPTSITAPVVLGQIDQVQVRADIDEQLAPRVRPGKNAIGYLKGDTTRAIPMEFVRIEPFIVPKKSLTGAPTERVDTRVLQVIFKFTNSAEQHVYVGQQLDLYLED